MDEVKLFCVIVGEAGSAFSVTVGKDQGVDDLKEAIKNRSDGKIDVPWPDLQLFLAKKGDGWLPDDDPAVQDLEEGKIRAEIKALIDGNKMKEAWTIEEVLVDNNMTGEGRAPKSRQIHVLVVVPGIMTTIEVDEIQDKERKDELEYYQRVGQEIQTKCQHHCGPILDKIDSIYEKKPYPMPFICVQGSSGMGKSQLAFALGSEGREKPRPWFYWSLGSAAVYDQLVYKNFSSIAKAFETVVRKDKLDDREEEDAFLACGSPVYTEDKLWTYGFIIELLRYCSRSSIGAQMVRFEKQTFKVTKSTQKDVIQVRSRMEENGEVLPFFILDEMTPSRNKRLSAFQLNVFRACGLVVIGMGTDANISNLTSKPRHSRSSPCWWMTAVTSFPPYQSIPFGDPEKEEAWKTAIQLDGVVKLIAKNSRGLFSRYFVDAVVDFVAENETLKLTDLLDSAFEVVRKKTQEAKASMMEPEEPFMYAQLMALSYTHSTAEAFNQEIRGGGATSERSLKKRTAEAFSQEIPGGDATIEHPSKKRKVSVECMQVHFANLEDEDITDVDVCGGELYRRSTEVGWGPACHFPAIDQDVLQYLAVLGGKQSAYCHHNKMEYSTVYAFENFRSQERQPHDNINSLSNSGDERENLVAHALFCASRRHGVGGIPFQEFFSALLGEFHPKQFAPVQFDVQELLRQYDGLWRKFAGADSMKIPFLAPPNAIWPDYILTARGDCNFGHLFRAKKQESLDLYVTAPKPDSQGVIQTGFPLFVCECKNWKNRLDSGAMRNIIAGLNADTVQGKPKWNKWDILLLFCNEITQFQTEVTDNWEYPGTGIVTVACKTGEVNWIVGENGGEKLVIVLLTGGVIADSVVE